MQLHFTLLTLTALLASTVVAQDPDRSSATVTTAPAEAAPPAPPSPVPADPHVIVPVSQITRLHGTMANTLIGKALVTGLAGTGSSDKASRQMMANYLKESGELNISDADLSTGSWAMVHVTAQLPAFAKAGMLLDVSVATIGDASSLYGGTLMTTVLRGLDGIAYATGDGPVAVSGFAVGKQGGTRVQRNNPTVGRVARGATVVRDVKSSFLSEKGDLELGLINPNLATAQGIAVAVNAALKGDGVRAGVVDENLVRIELPDKKKTDAEAIRVLGRIRELTVKVENPSTVIINEAAGIVLAGEGVRISPCVVALSDLTISVVSEDEVVQPTTPFTRGETATVNRTRIDVRTGATQTRAIGPGGATVAELLANLKALELSPRQMIEVFDFLAAGGYLQARLIKQ